MQLDSREGSPNAGQLQAIRARASQLVTFRIFASLFFGPLFLLSLEKNRLPFMGPFYWELLAADNNFISIFYLHQLWLYRPRFFRLGAKSNIETFQIPFCASFEPSLVINFSKSHYYGYK